MTAVIFRGAVLALAGFLFNSFAIAQTFVDVTDDLDMAVEFSAQSGLGGGCAWFDFDADGDQDLYITGGHNEDALFRNEGDGSFTNVIFEAGFLATSDKNTIGVVTGDIDNDGYREVFVTTQNIGFGFAHVENMLFYNNGDGTFTEITESAGLSETKWAFSATFLDVNADGLLDLFVANYVESAVVVLDDFNIPIGFDHQCYLDDLYINQGDLTFINGAEMYGALNEGCTLAVTGTDYDRDGEMDLLAINDFGEWVETSKLYENNAGAYSDVSVVSGWDLEIYGMGVAIGDYDEDLDLDYYVTNIGPNVLLEQSSPGQFEDKALEAGVLDETTGDGFAVGWGTFFFDYDNDSYLDLFVSNGFVDALPSLANDGDQDNTLYRGNADFEFTSVPDELPENVFRSRGCAHADYDGDGDLDFGVMSMRQQFDSAEDHFVLYENQGNENNFVAFDLEGLVCNRDAFGTQVEVHADGRSFLREVDGGSSHCSQNSSVLHFGLGEIESIDSVVVNWPIGPAQVFDTLGLNTFHAILQDTTVVNDPPDTLITGLGEIQFGSRLQIFPIPASESINLTLSGVAGNIQASIFDLHGRLVWEVYRGDVGIMPKQFDVPADLRSGCYICLITTHDGRKIAVKRVELISG